MSLGNICIERLTQNVIAKYEVNRKGYALTVT